jgi:hypothetical protein
MLALKYKKPFKKDIDIHQILNNVNNGSLLKIIYDQIEIGEWDKETDTRIMHSRLLSANHEYYTKILKSIIKTDFSQLKYKIIQEKPYIDKTNKLIIPTYTTVENSLMKLIFNKFEIYNVTIISKSKFKAKATFHYDLKYKLFTSIFEDMMTKNYMKLISYYAEKVEETI